MMQVLVLLTYLDMLGHARTTTQLDSTTKARSVSRMSNAIWKGMDFGRTALAIASPRSEHDHEPPSCNCLLGRRCSIVPRQRSMAILNAACVRPDGGAKRMKDNEGDGMGMIVHARVWANLRACCVCRHPWPPAGTQV